MALRHFGQLHFEQQQFEQVHFGLGGAVTALANRFRGFITNVGRMR